MTRLSKTANQIDAIINTRGKARVAILGTSLVNHNHAGSAAGALYSYARGWMAWAEAYAKYAFTCPIWWDDTVLEGWEPSGVPGATRYFQGLNFGVSGQYIEEIKDRVPYIIANYIDKFDHIIIDAGTNDMAVTDADSIQTDREYICDQFLAHGKTVTLLPILSRAISSWSSGGAERKKANWINSKTKEYINKTSGVYLFDWNMYWTNYTDTDGVPYADNTGDGIHFDAPGAELVGKALADHLLDILPAQPYSLIQPDDLYDATYNEKGSLITINPLLLGGSAGANGTGSSGNVVTGARIERSTATASTVANTIEADSDGYGNVQVMTFTLGTTDAKEDFYFRTSSADTSIAFAGEFIQAGIEVETNNSDAILGLQLEINEPDLSYSTIGLYTYTWAEKGVLTPFPAMERRIAIKTPAFLVPDTTTRVRYRLRIIIDGTASVAPVIKVRNPWLKKVDDPSV